MIKASKDIVVVIAEIDDEVIQQLKQSDDQHKDLNAVINEYANQLEGKGIEVFDRGNDFIVCEEGIYIACYADEFDEKFEE
jgi:hypothetical protein